MEHGSGFADEVTAYFRLRHGQRVSWVGDPSTVYAVHWRRYVEPPQGMRTGPFCEYGLVATGQPEGSIPRLVWAMDMDLAPLTEGGPPCC